MVNLMSKPSWHEKISDSFEKLGKLLGFAPKKGHPIHIKVSTITDSGENEASKMSSTRYADCAWVLNYELKLKNNRLAFLEFKKFFVAFEFESAGINPSNIIKYRYSDIAFQPEYLAVIIKDRSQFLYKEILKDFASKLSMNIILIDDAKNIQDALFRFLLEFLFRIQFDYFLSLDFLERISKVKVDQLRDYKDNIVLIMQLGELKRDDLKYLRRVLLYAFRDLGKIPVIVSLAKEDLEKIMSSSDGINKVRELTIKCTDVLIISDMGKKILELPTNGTIKLKDIIKEFVEKCLCENRGLIITGGYGFTDPYYCDILSRISIKVEGITKCDKNVTMEFEHLKISFRGYNELKDIKQNKNLEIWGKWKINNKEELPAVIFRKISKDTDQNAGWILIFTTDCSPYWGDPNILRSSDFTNLWKRIIQKIYEHL